MKEKANKRDQKTNRSDLLNKLQFAERPTRVTDGSERWNHYLSRVHEFLLNGTLNHLQSINIKLQSYKNSESVILARTIKLNIKLSFFHAGLFCCYKSSQSHLVILTILAWQMRKSSWWIMSIIFPIQTGIKFVSKILICDINECFTLMLHLFYCNLNLTANRY